MIEGCRAERSAHGRRPGQPGHPSTPTPDLPACPTLGVASEQKVARPLLVARGGTRSRVAACRRWDGARGVVRSDDSRRRHYAPYRYSRNPGYLSLTMLYVGIAILRNALWAIPLLLLVVYVIQREVIEREERYLERTFGEEYLAYKRRVRRWV